MPVELVARLPAAQPALRRPALVFVAQLAAIVAVAGLTLAFASLPSSTIRGSAQEIVAGP